MGYLTFRPQPDPSMEPKWITKYAFRRRFTDQEKEDLELAAAHNPSDTVANRRQAAKIRLWMEDVRQMDFINLEDPKIINGVNAMETNGIVGTGRAAQILSTDIGEGERYETVIRANR